MKTQAIKILLSVMALAATLCFSDRLDATKKPARVSREDQVVTFHQIRAASRPDDADAWRMLASAYVQRAIANGDGADYDRGWKTLEKAESLDKGDIRILQARAQLLLARHHFQQARKLAEQGLKQDPSNQELLGVAGDGALETGDLDAAADYYERFHQAGARLTSFARLAHVSEVRGNLGQAAQLLNDALKAGYERGSLPEARAWCRAVLGEVELLRGEPEEARRQYIAGLKESPNHLLVLEHFAELEQTEGNLKAAEENYRRILARKVDPKSELRLAAILEARGEKHEAARLREESKRFYERAVASGDEGYLRPLAVAELVRGHYEQAAALQARDVALRPTTESRALLQTILDMAAAAGRPAVWSAALRAAR